MTSNVTDKPAGRRDVFLFIALAVAKHNLPTPDLRLYPQHPSVSLDVADDVEAKLWGEYLGLEHDESIPTANGDETIHRWNGTRTDGWRWYVRAVTPGQLSDLAAELVAALEPAVHGGR